MKKQRIQLIDKLHQLLYFCRSMKHIILVMTFLALLNPAFGFAAGIKAVDREVYGIDPLHPSVTSLLGKFLAETKAVNYARAFPDANGKMGPERLVVLVSGETFPIFQKYFSTSSFLFHFHEPHQHVFTAAFEGRRGAMGRLRDEFRYTYSGVLAIPVLLTSKEGAVAENYFNLALKVSRKNDVALFPWRLTSEQGLPYCEKGNEKSFADWFVNLPLGKLDRRQDAHRYEVCNLVPEAQSMIQKVWCAPHQRRSLGELLKLKSLTEPNEVLTPGRIGRTLLASAEVTRVPVVFRFTDIDPITPFTRDFDTYFDVEYNPADECKK